MKICWAGPSVSCQKCRPIASKKIHDIAQQTPRTTVLRGSVESGRITYVTRTKLIGFPDYTTVQLEDGTLMVHARLRFGRSDFGVNRARAERWIEGRMTGSPWKFRATSEHSATSGIAP